MTDLAAPSLSECAAAIRYREVRVVDVLEDCLTGIERLQPVLNCFISVDAEGARRSAEIADAEIAAGGTLGPLHGVPLVRKDCLYRSGKVATCGSMVNKDFRPEITATVVARLDKAGAIELGAAHLAEWAFGATGHNEHFGSCHNPWDLERIPGGSSSGSAASVAAGLCYGSVGTDLGGSVRIPAACCGLVGLKPTMTRVSRFGGMPMSFSMDHAGPITRTVEDCALLLSVIAGADPLDPISSNVPVDDYSATLGRSIEGLRIGICREEDARTHPGVLAVLDESRRRFRDLGAAIVEIELPDIEELDRIANLVQMAEAASAHGPRLKARPGDFSDQVRHRIEPGFVIPATRYIEALTLRPLLLRDFIASTFEHIDILQLPVLSQPVPTLAETDVKGDASMPSVIASLVRYTRWLSYLGLPALALPAGSFAHLPVAMQIVGRPYSESLLLNAGHMYETSASTRRRVPPTANFSEVQRTSKPARARQ